MKNSARRYFWFDFPIVIIAASLFGTWLKNQQLRIISPKLSPLYPLSFRMEDLALVLLCFLCLNLGQLAATNYLSRSLPLRIHAARLLSFFCPSLVYLGLSLSTSLQLCLLGNALFFCFLFFKQRRSLPTKLKLHGLSFLLIGILQLLANQVLSPIGWKNPIAQVQQKESMLLGVTSDLHRQNFVEAKRYDFSGFDFAYWGSLSHSPTAYSSPLLSWVTLLLDLPTISLESFHRALLGLLLSATVLSSFGFYLFCFLILRIPFRLSTIGGVFFLFLNPFFAYLLNQHFPGFVSVFLIMPYALLFTSLGMRRNSLFYSALGGLMIPGSFLFEAPHPDSLVHGTAFWLGYLFFQILFETKPSFSRKLQLALIGVVCFLAGSAEFSLPIFEEISLKEAFFFGHREGVFNYRFRDGLQYILWPLLSTGGIAVCLLLSWAKAIWKSKVFKATFVYATSLGLIFLLTFVPGNSGPIERVIAAFTPFYFLNPYRPLLYLPLLSLSLILMGLARWLKKGVSVTPFLIGGSSMFLIYFGFAIFHPSLIANSFYHYDGVGPKLLLKISIATVVLILGILPKKHFSRQQKYFQILGCALVFFASAMISHWQIPSKQNSVFYTSLQSLVTNYRSTGIWDSASLEWIRRRLIQFEKESGLPLPESYAQALSDFHVSTATELNRENLISFANEVAPLVDTRASMSPAEWIPNKKQIAMPRDHGPIAYTNAGIFQNLAPRFSRIVSFTNDNSLLGIDEAFLINNSNMKVDTRFGSVFPPISYLFLIPGNLYPATGNYRLPTPWLLDPTLLKDPSNRKLMDIAGVDAFVVRNSDRPFISKLPDTEEIPYAMPDRYRPELTVFKNLRSFGMVYSPQREIEVPDSLEVLKQNHPPFEKHRTSFLEHEMTVAKLRHQLTRLSQKESVIELEPGQPLLETHPGRIQIENIGGNKAVFRMQCPAGNCDLVFNTAAITGWHAFLEGNQIPWRRANYAFLSVTVPSGNHLVWFEYRRFGAEMGLVISLLTTFLVLFSGLKLVPSFQFVRLPFQVKISRNHPETAEV